MAPTPARAPSRPGALFDAGPDGGPAEFRDPLKGITAATPADLPEAFAAMARAQAAGVEVVMDRCPKIELQRLNGELRMGGFATGRISSRL